MASNLQCVVHNSTIHDPGGMQPLTEEKLEQFLRVKKKRLSQPISSSARMAAICATIPESISPIHGYHTNCAKRFTMNQHRLTVDEPRSTVNTFQHIPRGKSSILFPFYFQKRGSGMLRTCIQRPVKTKLMVTETSNMA